MDIYQKVDFEKSDYLQSHILIYQAYHTSVLDPLANHYETKSALKKINKIIFQILGPVDLWTRFYFLDQSKLFLYFEYALVRAKMEAIKVGRRWYEKDCYSPDQQDSIVFII